MKTRQHNEEVLFATDERVKIINEDIELLKQQMGHNRRKRIRLCAHPGVEDSLHEMFIVFTKDTYVRPHQHLTKTESFHVIEGTFDIVVFDDAGNITGITRMGDYRSGRPFYHRATEPTYHTLLITSDVLVFEEITTGPFDPSDTLWAPWAPDQNDSVGGREFVDRLASSVEDFLGRGEQTAVT